MAHILNNKDLVTTTPAPAPEWTLRGVIEALLRTRREIQAISRRARLQYGYGHVPRRVWDRRSAWFIER